MAKHSASGILRPSKKARSSALTSSKDSRPIDIDSNISDDKFEANLCKDTTEEELSKLSNTHGYLTISIF